jgi:Domain of unknown function (DUF4440)
MKIPTSGNLGKWGQGREDADPGNRLVIGFVVFCGMLLFARSLLCEREPSAKNELVALEQHWLEVEDDPQALDSILAPDFLHVVPAGIITKSDQIDFMRKHPSPEQRATKHFEDMHVRVYGIVGIVNGIVVASDGETTKRTLFTDVFVYRASKWQAVNAQELPAATKGR